ncbi:MAG: AIR synthase related protein [Gammaproteobacteria bacterium]|nr:AIR synthase related protein [Gammaproteobacteria bacterium]
MIDRPLAAGKLPVTLLRDLLSGDTPPPPELLLPPAIGEDAGVIQISGGALIVAADPVTLTGSDVGAHAVMVNANDVAVMGARPRWFLCIVLLPLGTTEADVRALFHGLRVALDSVGAVLVGGHTEVTASVTQPVVAGQMLGLREDGHFVRTGGMQEGDVVLQVGPAPIEGAAVLAREARERLVDVDTEIIERARDALRNPGISVVNPSLRATELGANALHDPTEGGLSAGLFELAEASGVALSVTAEAVLWFEPATVICKALGADPWGVLASGTLLAAFPKRYTHQAQAALEADGYSVAAIAHAEAGIGVRRLDGLEFRRYERDELSRILIA